MGVSINQGKGVGKALVIYEWMDDMLKSLGIVVGGLAASIADWIFGAVTMGVLLSGYGEFNNPFTKWLVGGIFSMALWGIQIILWRIVLTGKITKIGTKGTATIVYIIVFAVIVAMKFGDDFTDITGVYWLIKDNPMQSVFGMGMLYKALLGTIFFLVWVICGFAEVFVALSIGLLKEGGGGGGKGKQQSQQFRQSNRGDYPHGGGQNRRAELEAQFRKPATEMSGDTGKFHTFDQ